VIRGPAQIVQEGGVEADVVEEIPCFRVLFHDVIQMVGIAGDELVVEVAEDETLEALILRRGGGAKRDAAHRDAFPLASAGALESPLEVAIDAVRAPVQKAGGVEGLFSFGVTESDQEPGSSREAVDTDPQRVGLVVDVPRGAGSEFVVEHFAKRKRKAGTAGRLLVKPPRAALLQELP